MSNQMQMNVNLEDTTEIKCEKCESIVFNQGMLLRGVSRFITGTAQDAVMPIAVFYCAKCSHINEQFMPKTKPAEDKVSVEDVTPKKTPFTIVK